MNVFHCKYLTLLYHLSLYGLVRKMNKVFQLRLQEAELEQAMECTLSKFPGDIKVRGPLDNLCYSEGCRRLGERVNKNLLKFRKDKYQNLHVGRKCLLQWYRLGPDCLGSSSAEKDLERCWWLVSWAWARGVSWQRRPRATRAEVTGARLGGPGEWLYSSPLYLSNHM